MHHVIILDPGVSSREPKGTYPPYDDGFKDGLFIKNESGLPLEGQVCLFNLYNSLNVFLIVILSRFGILMEAQYSQILLIQILLIIGLI